jgi:hypothetical protein
LAGYEPGIISSLYPVSDLINPLGGARMHKIILFRILGGILNCRSWYDLNQAGRMVQKKFIPKGGNYG